MAGRTHYYFSDFPIAGKIIAAGLLARG